MEESSIRMTQAGDPPSEPAVAKWIGKSAHRYWKLITRLIEETYPGALAPQWLFGGQKHGWSLRYKKSKSFCALIPEKDRLALQIVFGAAERTKVAAIINDLTPKTRQAYDAATTYHDGKWLLLTIDSDKAVADTMQLLAVKRKPKDKK